MPTKCLKVIIMGGSLGGLSAGHWLRQQGHDVKILERSRDSLIEKGAGIVLSNYTIQFLLQYHQVDLNLFSLPIHCIRFIQSNGSPPFDTKAPFRVSSYSALYQILLDTFGTERYYLNHCVSGIQQDHDTVIVTTADGKKHQCDLLLCMDGTGSTARTLLNIPYVSAYSGYVAWRGTFCSSLLPPDLRAEIHRAALYHLREDSHFVAYPIPRRRRSSKREDDQFEIDVNWLWYRKVEDGSDLNLLMTDRNGIRRDKSVPPGFASEVHISKLREDSKQVETPFREYIELTAEPFLQAVYDVACERTVAGRACILGDAAFSIRPHISVGTAKAVEDAHQLAKHLENYGGNIDRALDLWQEHQQNLGRSCLKRSRELGTLLMNGKWQVGDSIKFGLYKAGDSAMH